MGKYSPARDEEFNLVGVRPGTFQRVFEFAKFNKDPIEQLIRMSLFQRAWRAALDENAISQKLAKCCPSELEAIATVDIRLLDHLFEPPVLSHTFFEKDRACPICQECFEQGDEIVLTECQHLFHRSCCLRWALQIIGKESCACCRDPIERLYFGKYDKDRENISTWRIRVISAIPGKHNLWKVSQFEYLEDGVPDWACLRVILDNREWYIDSGNQFFLPLWPAQPNPNPHPMSSRQVEWNRWNDSPTYHNLAEFRKSYMSAVKEYGQLPINIRGTPLLSPHLLGELQKVLSLAEPSVSDFWYRIWYRVLVATQSCPKCDAILCTRCSGRFDFLGYSDVQTTQTIETEYLEGQSLLSNAINRLTRIRKKEASDRSAGEPCPGTVSKKSRNKESRNKESRNKESRSKESRNKESRNKG